MLRESERLKLAETLPKTRALQVMYSMRSELAAVWGRSMATQHQLVKQLHHWCQRAEASGIDDLQRFAQELRSYASLSPGRLPAPAHRNSSTRSGPQ
jgi:stearoyl-CoA desaturase (delta-9 desaturase)